MKAEDREKLVDAIEKVILLCDGSQPVRFPDRGERLAGRRYGGVTPSEFRECEALIGPSEDLVGVEDWRMFHSADVEPKHLPKGWHGAFARMDKDESGAEAIVLRQAEWASVKSVRGLGRLRTGILCRYSWVKISTEDDGFFGFSAPYEWGGKKWSFVGTSSDHEMFLAGGKEGLHRGFFDSSDDSTKHIALCASQHESSDLQWGIEVRGERGFSLRFTCSVKAARSAFCDRDAGPSGRRAALRNWVREHYRRSRVKDDDEDEAAKLVFVRQHLRGKVPFRWHGLDCNVLVAPFDIRRNALLAERRANMGATVS